MIFNGKEWSFCDSPLTGPYPRSVVYEHVANLDDFQPWLEKIIGFPPELIRLLVDLVPIEWFTGDEPHLERVVS